MTFVLPDRKEVESVYRKRKILGFFILICFGLTVGATCLLVPDGLLRWMPLIGVLLGMLVGKMIFRLTMRLYPYPGYKGTDGKSSPYVRGS